MKDDVYERMKTYIAEQTALPVETIEAVLLAEERFRYRGWRAPVDAVEELDKTAAQRIASTATRPITIGSFPDWMSRGLDTRTDELLDLIGGVAHLRLADRTQWICSALLYSDEHGLKENRFLQRLDALALEHRALRGCAFGSHRLLFIRQNTLDYRWVFCIGCWLASAESGWCDLQADAEEADRTLSPGVKMGRLVE